jgi:hypothetical protein
MQNPTEQFIAAVFGDIPPGAWGYLWTDAGNTTFPFQTPEQAVELALAHRDAGNQ